MRLAVATLTFLFGIEIRAQTIAIAVLAYVVALVFILSLLTAAKRGEEASRRAARDRMEEVRREEERRDVA